MIVNRLLSLEKFSSSCFLFGPRMTGKTTLLRQLGADAYYDLLSTDLFVKLNANPEIFRGELLALGKGSTVIVDEIQRIPALLDSVQVGIEERGHRFILSGSSARKLRRGSANLLGGRALDLRLHPLTSVELSEKFDINLALRFGVLPKPYLIALEGSHLEARQLLKSYYTTYIDQEIKQEALTRNLGAFQRFLKVAAQFHGQEIVYSNISNKSQVPASTVKQYFEIVEDTLIGGMLWQYSKSEKNKSRGKFFLFDPGVVRAIQNRLHSDPAPEELGHLFEGWFLGELIRLRDYNFMPHTFSFWKRAGYEIDIVVELNGKPVLAFEIKSGSITSIPKSVKKFKESFQGVQCHLVSLTAEADRSIDDLSTILPWYRALEEFQRLSQ